MTYRDLATLHEVRETIIMIWYDGGPIVSNATLVLSERGNQLYRYLLRRLPAGMNFIATLEKEGLGAILDLFDRVEAEWRAQM